MHRATTCLMGVSLAVLAGGVVLAPQSRAGDIGFIEDFALAKDRDAALKQLIPGTEDYYYYHCLHYLNSGQFEKVEPLTKLWYERHRQTARLTEIQTRHALLTFDKDPKAALAYVTGRLGLHFSHQKEIAGAAPNLPTQLDAKLIARDTLRAASFSRWGQPHQLRGAGPGVARGGEPVVGEPAGTARAAHPTRPAEPPETRRR